MAITVRDGDGVARAQASSEWSGVFYGLKEYLFVSLADEPLALLSAQTIGLFCDALGVCARTRTIIQTRTHAHVRTRETRARRAF
jgi:hypothetical protein